MLNRDGSPPDLFDASAAIDGSDYPRRAGPIARIIVLTSSVLIPLLVPHARRFPLLVVAGFAVVCCHLGTFGIAGHFASACLDQLSIGMGGYLARIRCRGTTYFLGWLPLGGYVKFRGWTGDEPPMRDPTAPIGSFASIHPLTRAAVILAGPAALLILAACTLGASEAIDAFRSVPSECLALLVGTEASRRAVGKGFVAMLDRRSAMEHVGQIATTVAFVNLFPLPIMNGGQALREVLQWALGRTVTQNALLPLFYLGSLLSIWLLVAFIVAAAFAWNAV